MSRDELRTSEGVILLIDVEAGFCGDENDVGEAEGLCDEGEHISSRVLTIVVADAEVSAALYAKKDYTSADECREG